MNEQREGVSRRTFMGGAALAAAAFQAVPSRVLGLDGQTPPSRKLNIAGIGVGGMGGHNIEKCAETENIVALCDVDQNYAAHTFKKYSGAKVYNDYREMLDKQKDIDAVVIATPDHTHAPIAMACMRAGKHVYVQKPMAYSVGEARAMTEAARKYKVITQMGNQGRSGDGVRMVCEWIWAGAVGTVREVHAWTNRPVWPQYPMLPTDTPPVPKDFDWDLWLGPSLERAYHPHYTHAVFRGWYEFGGGAIADMGHYSLWRVFSEFGLDAPVSVESTPSHVCTLRNNVSVKVVNDYSFPEATTVHFKFAAKGDRPALDLFWYDGGIRPRTPDELEVANEELPAEGMLFVGEKGKILGGFRGEKPRVLSGGNPGALPAPKPVNTDWVKAFRGGEATSGSFLNAGPLSDAVNLAAVSMRLGGKRLLWDATNATVTNRTEAAKYLTREYRKGWEI